MLTDPLMYCGVAESVWNRHPVSPGSHACVSPVYGKTLDGRRETRVRLPKDTECIQDSGAFSDGPGRRLDPKAALERQQAHSLKYDYNDQVTHRASYDFLIDESWTDGNRPKRRWTAQDAEEAVTTTIEAAHFMAGNSDRPAILSAQGVNADQYIRCTQGVAPFLREGDIFGLGGFCVTGKMPAQMLPVLQDTLWKVIPWIARRGVKRVHIFGVIYPHALGQLLWICDQHDIAISTDSIGPNLNPVRGEWGYGNWRDPHYVRPPVEHLGSDRARHVELTREWVRTLRVTRYYRQPSRTFAKQLYFLSNATP